MTRVLKHSLYNRSPKFTIDHQNLPHQNFFKWSMWTHLKWVELSS